MVILMDFLLCGLVYGYDGMDSFVGATNISFFIMAQSWSVTIWTVKYFLIVVLFRSFIGVILLCAVTIFISAGCQSSFHAVSVAAVAIVFSMICVIAAYRKYKRPQAI